MAATNRLYIEGWDNFSPEEQQLMLKVSDFSVLFEDMLFYPLTYSGSLVREGNYDEQRGQWFQGVMSRPSILENFDIFDQFRFKVFQPGDLADDDEEDTLGYFDGKKRELWVRADQLDSDDTILHELIHLYEYFLGSEDVPPYCRDMFFMALYLHVSKKIKGLELLVASHANLLTQHNLAVRGGVHDVLFLLKSFELDMRKGYPLGTVFMYGRADKFKGYSYEPYEEE